MFIMGRGDPVPLYRPQNVQLMIGVKTPNDVQRIIAAIAHEALTEISKLVGCFPQGERRASQSKQRAVLISRDGFSYKMLSQFVIPAVILGRNSVFKLLKSWIPDRSIRG